jgi:hypothetical protein
MGEYLGLLALGLVPLWGAVEGISKIWASVNKNILSLIIGIVGAIILHGSGLLVAPGAAPWSWAVAVFGGLAVGAGAGIVNDRVAKPTVAFVTGKTGGTE